jgi:hypothetical protein
MEESAAGARGFNLEDISIIADVAQLLHGDWNFAKEMHRHTFPYFEPNFLCSILSWPLDIRWTRS